MEILGSQRAQQRQEATVAEALLGRGHPLLARLFPKTALADRAKGREVENEVETKRKIAHRENMAEAAKRRGSHSDNARSGVGSGKTDALAQQRATRGNVISFVKRGFGAIMGKKRMKRAATARKRRPSSRRTQGSQSGGVPKKWDTTTAGSAPSSVMTVPASVLACPIAGGPRFALGYISEEGDVSRARLFAEQYVLARFRNGDSHDSDHGGRDLTCEHGFASSSVEDALRATAHAVGEADLSEEDRAYVAKFGQNT